MVSIVTLDYTFAKNKVSEAQLETRATNVNTKGGVPSTKKDLPLDGLFLQKRENDIYLGANFLFSLYTCTN